MASSLAVKRMLKERVELEKTNSEYLVYFQDNDLLKFEAYIIGPDDSLYQYKFVKLVFQIPSQYPLVPPKVKFIQHSGSRIHPNLYVDGKVCLSILGTFQGPSWAFGMSCHTGRYEIAVINNFSILFNNVDVVLITIRSLLDSSPYQHEPGQHDHPEFNAFVQYATWRCLLVDYLVKEENQTALLALRSIVNQNGQQIIEQLASQQQTNAYRRHFSSPYRDHTIGTSKICSSPPDYVTLLRDVQNLVESTRRAVVESDTDNKTRLVSVSQVSVALQPIASDESTKSNGKRSVVDITGTDEEEDDAVTHTSNDQSRKKRLKSTPTPASEIVDLT